MANNGMKLSKNDYRKLFPITESYVFLDHAGVGPVSVRAIQSVQKFLEEASTQSSFIYDDWMERVDGIRKKCSELIRSNSDEIAFIKNTSHGISIVASGLDWERGDNVLVYEKEFPSNIYPWLNLEKNGVEVRFIKSRDDGEIYIDDIKNLADSKTRLISMSSVQFTSGFRIDLNALGNFCKQNGIYFFVDAIQSLGVVPMDVKECGIDFLAADGHKWMISPEGTGFFYCSGGVSKSINPSLVGWKSIVNEGEYEKINFSLKGNALKFEEGSINVMGVLALGASLELLLEVGVENIKQEVQRLGDEIIKGALDRDFFVKTPKDKNKRGGIIVFSGNFDSVDLKQKLQQLNIMVNARGGGLRVSPHFYNSDDDIEQLFKAIDNILNN